MGLDSSILCYIYFTIDNFFNLADFKNIWKYDATKNTCALRGAQWRFMTGETTAGWSAQLHSDWSVAEGRPTEVVSESTLETARLNRDSPGGQTAGRGSQRADDAEKALAPPLWEIRATQSSSKSRGGKESSVGWDIQICRKLKEEN